jgi:N-acetylneuraminate 9-O-acetyltransferase
MGGHSGHYTSDKFLYWQPPGCLLHKYNARDIESCLQCKRLLFVGDSTIRQVFWATARKLDGPRASEMALSAEQHGDLRFEQGCVKIEFLWDHFLNSTMLKNELERYQLRTSSPNSTQVAAILVGTGLWHAKGLGPGFLNGFEHSIDSVAALLPRNALDSNRLRLPPRARKGVQDLVLFAPVSVPTESKLDTMRAEKFAPGRIHAMKDYLRRVADRDTLDVLWSYSLMTWQRPSAYEEDGYHVVENVANRQADIFLNMRCNDEPSLDHYPFDKTCCKLQPFVNREQYLMILTATIITIYALYGLITSQSNYENSSNILATKVAVRAAAILAISILYCFAADRTLIFDRLQKVPNQRMFLLLVALTSLGGLISVRRSGSRAAGISAKLPRTAPVQTFLSRDQTEEWKGWMQFVILIYHYTGMSTVLWVYQVIRLLVASYLFMTGYGHTIYFLKTNNFSLHRVASVLIRLNLLSCLLAYLMRTDYNFYYFPALSSFWFLVVYLTIRIRYQPNVVPTMLILRILISAVLVQVLVQTPGVLERFFEFLEKTCNMNLDVQELRFRLSLDAYIVYAGMLAAILYLQITGAAPCSTTCLATQIKKIPTTVHVLAVIASLIVLPAYFVLIRRCPDKYDYNLWHPIISPLPVLAFVMLRNATQGLRDYHSRLFAWLGRFSLETFILQYHIWLAADTKALLSLGLWTRSGGTDDGWPGKLGCWCEFMLITSLFLWASLAVSTATNVLTSFIVQSQGTAEASVLLRPTNWRQVSGILTQDAVDSQPQEHARSRSTLLEQGHGGKDDMKTSALPHQEHLTTSKTSSLIVRLVAILLLMWIGNWVRMQHGWSEALTHCLRLLGLRVT